MGRWHPLFVDAGHRLLQLVDDHADATGINPGVLERLLEHDKIADGLARAGGKIRERMPHFDRLAELVQRLDRFEGLFGEVFGEPEHDAGFRNFADSNCRCLELEQLARGLLDLVELFGHRLDLDLY